MISRDAALDRLQRMASGSNPPIGTRSGAEQVYAAAYQREVRQGTARQLRKKYRSP